MSIIKKSLECEELFNMIILDVAHGDIYSAWDAANYCSIEDFKSESGKIVSANRSNAIIKLPSTLCFQLQRVAFEKERGTFKRNDVFNFENELFVDRFIFVYKERYQIVREKVKKLKAEVDEIEKMIKGVTNYQNSNVNLSSLLTLAGKFIQTQKEMEGEELSKSDLTAIGNLDNSNESLDTVTKILGKYQEKVEEKLRSHEEMVKNLKATIEASYEEFKGSRYLLQSILMHEGSAESGHYYSYIYDFEKKIWRKFNDLIVSEEKDEVVMSNAKGNGIISAYCLIYLREDLAIRESPSPSQQNSASTSFSDSSYVQLVRQNDELFKEVTNANAVFKGKLEEFIVSREVTAMVDDYQLKLQQLIEISEKIKEKHKDRKLAPPFLLNFAVYLQTQNKNELARHHILISLLKGRLFEESIENKFKEQLMRKIHTLPQNSQAVLNLPNPHEYHLFHKNYDNEFASAKILLKSYEHIFAREFYIGCTLIYYIMNLVILKLIKQLKNNPNHKTNYFFKISKDMLKMLSFIILDSAFEVLKKKEIAEEGKIIESVKLISYISALLIPKIDPFFMNISQILTDLEVMCRDLEMEAISMKLNESNKILMETKETTDSTSLIKEGEALTKSGDFGYDPFDISFTTTDDELYMFLVLKFDEFKTKFQKYVAFYTQVVNEKRIISKETRTKIGLN